MRNVRGDTSCGLKVSSCKLRNKIARKMRVVNAGWWIGIADRETVYSIEYRVSSERERKGDRQFFIIKKVASPLFIY